MSYIKIKGLLLFTLVMPLAAHAVTIEIAGGTPIDGFWDVTALPSGTFPSNQTLLESQPWWGDEGLASQFANKVGDDLGTPNGSAGPYFAYESETSLGIPQIVSLGLSPVFSLILRSSDSLSTHLVFAVATPSPVPLPAAAWLFLSALGGLFGMRKLRGG